MKITILFFFLLFSNVSLKAQDFIAYKEYTTTYTPVKDSIIKANQLLLFNDTLHLLSYQIIFPFQKKDYYALTSTQKIIKDSLITNPAKYDVVENDSLNDDIHYRLDSTVWKGGLYWQQLLEAKALGKEIEKEFEKFGIVAYWDVIFRYHNSQKNKLDFDNYIYFQNGNDKNKNVQILLNFFKLKNVLHKVTIARCVGADKALIDLMQNEISNIKQNWFYEVIFPISFQGTYLLPEFTNNINLE